MSSKKEEVTEESTFDISDVENSPRNGEPTKAKEPYWKSMMAVVTGGCAFMSDGYQQGIMTPINLLLAKSMTDYSSNYKTMVSNSNLVANIIGQVAFGLFVDLVGRKQGFTITTSFIIIGSIIAACAKGTPDSKLFWMLIIARGISGVGIGGEYPTSAAAAMEAAEERLSGDRKYVPFICSTNFPISLGLPFATCVFLIFQAIWGETRYNPTWRSCFGFGAIFPMIILYFRLKMDHSELFKRNAIKRNVPYKLIFKRYWKDLAGVSGVWFIMDFVIYPNNIFSSSVLTIIIPNATIKKTAEWLLLLGFFATIGSLLGMALLPYLTKKQFIMIGFLLYGILSIVLGAAFTQLSKIPGLFITFYALMNVVIYMGPANIQSIIATVPFATPARGTLYGLAAAIGKAGAAVGTEVFTPIQTQLGSRYTFFVSGGICFLGIIVCHFLVPAVEDCDLAKQDEEFAQYLIDNGWTGAVGEKEGKHDIGASPS